MVTPICSLTAVLLLSEARLHRIFHLGLFQPYHYPTYIFQVVLGYAAIEESRCEIYCVFVCVCVLLYYFMICCAIRIL